MLSSLLEDPDRASPAVLLESQLEDHPASRRTIYAADPDTVIRARGCQITIESDGMVSDTEGDPWRAVQELRSRRPGWYVGYLGYDLKNNLEKLHSRNEDPVGAPDMILFRPRLLLIYDHISEQLTLTSGTSEEGEKVQTKRVEELIRRFQSNRVQADGEIGRVQVSDLVSLTGQTLYMDRIRKAQQLIRDGDIYEVNLSHMLRGAFSGSRLDLYRRMRRAGPVPFGSWLDFGEFTICSASPERFIRREGNRISSQPIKGTAPRQTDTAADGQTRQLLVESEKERAENLMIVDLVRHDFSRIARPGSVRVPELFSLQSFNTVHQLVSTVEAEVTPGTDPVEIIKACFPMGSMTGAPKIRSMEVIEELEDYRRGIYSGAIGYLDPDDQFDFSVVIRTAVIRDGQIFYPVGGAVTSGSDPEGEWEETRVKTRALIKALGK